MIRTAPWIEVSWSYALLGKEEQLQGNIDLSSTTITSYRKSLNLRLVAPHDELDRLKSYWKDAKSAEAREIHSEMSGVSIFIGKSVEDSR